MPITIAGSGTITGISAGGLPDDSIIAADIAAGAVTTAKVADANITAAKLDGAQSGSAPIYAARAWVNFNGTGVVAIRASGNVSSITDNGTGDYTVNFTTAMVDAKYVVNFSCGESSQTGNPNYITGLKTPGLLSSSFRFMTLYSGNTAGDFDIVCVSVFR